MFAPSKEVSFSIGTLLRVRPKVRQVDCNACWKGTELTHWQVLERILRNGHAINPLLQVPWFKCSLCRADWLHVSDQGVASDFLGNLFKICEEKLEGASIKARVKVLSTKMQNWCRDNNVQDRMDCLLPAHWTQKKKGFKLRASAAQVRALVPFGQALAEELLSDEVPAERALKAAAVHLNTVYMTLSESFVFQTDTAIEHSTKFALQYVALHDFFHPYDDRQFRIKPKLHLFLHLCHDGCRPARYWNYRDEDWGGSVARFSRRKGGLLSAGAMSTNVLERFAANQPMFRVA